MFEIEASFNWKNYRGWKKSPRFDSKMHTESMMEFYVLWNVKRNIVKVMDAKLCLYLKLTFRDCNNSFNYYSTTCNNTMGIKKKGKISQFFETTTGQNDLVSCKLNGTENFHMTWQSGKTDLHHLHVDSVREKKKKFARFEHRIHSNIVNRYSYGIRKVHISKHFSFKIFLTLKENNIVRIYYSTVIPFATGSRRLNANFSRAFFKVPTVCPAKKILIYRSRVTLVEPCKPGHTRNGTI